MTISKCPKVEVAAEGSELDVSTDTAKKVWQVPQLKQYARARTLVQGGAKLNIEGSSYHS